MSLSLRRLPSVSRATRPARTRSARSRSIAVVRASFFDDIAAGVVRIFTPILSGNKEDWKGTDTPFTGDIQHHGQPGSRRPFKDGWSGKPQTAKKAAASSAASEQAAPEAAPEQAAPAAAGPAAEPSNVVTFLNKAVESVVAHNFTGDATEPEAWKKPDAKPAGWTGDIHTRGRDGFHTTKK